MTTVSLNAALSGLKAAQRSLDTVSNNIANATTPGYTRKILPQETLIISGVGSGVSSNALVRNVDAVLQRDLVRQVSISNHSLVGEKYLNRIMDFNGASEAEQSLSANISRLSESFAELSSSPDSNLSLARTLSTAQEVANKFNDFFQLLSQMRSETEGEISSAITTINAALERIAELNVQINTLGSAGQSTANLEDQRDIAIREVSQYLEVSTFPSGNGKIVVMTRQGQVLADETAHQLLFDNSNVLPTSYYPGGGLSGIFLDSFSGIEISNTTLGGKIGGLLELRDNTLPTYQAQLDEMAQKLSHRMDQQGLRLFTDASGNVPANVADPGVVGYIGYAAQIQVNNAIVNDPTLIRSGTNGNTVLEGSNEIIRKISQFAFGDFAGQTAIGAIDISAGDLFTTLGLQPTNRVVGNTTITSYTPSLDTHPDIAAGATFDLTINAVANTITVNPGDTAIDLVNSINTAFGPGTASLNGLGQLAIDANASIEFADNTIGAAGMAALGFSFGITPAEDPSFTVQVGTQSPVTIIISAGDTAADLLADLNVISGMTASLGGGGELVMTPTEGGDLTIVDISGAPLNAMGVSLSNISHTAFRQNNLGPDGSLSTGLLANGSLESYARSIITGQSEDGRTAQDQVEKNNTFLNILDKRQQDQAGVNLDEEMSEMIRIQSNYAAAARMISTSEQMLDALMDAFR